MWLASEEIQQCFGLLMSDLCNPMNCKLQAQQWRISAIFESLTHPCRPQVLQVSSGANSMEWRLLNWAALGIMDWDDVFGEKEP